MQKHKHDNTELKSTQFSKNSQTTTNKTITIKLDKKTKISKSKIKQNPQVWIQIILGKNKLKKKEQNFNEERYLLRIVKSKDEKNNQDNEEKEPLRLKHTCWENPNHCFALRDNPQLHQPQTQAHRFIDVEKR